MVIILLTFIIQDFHDFIRNCLFMINFIINQVNHVGIYCNYSSISIKLMYRIDQHILQTYWIKSQNQNYQTLVFLFTHFLIIDCWYEYEDDITCLIWKVLIILVIKQVKILLMYELENHKLFVYSYLLQLNFRQLIRFYLAW
jgi:hypothetical protein